jgi:hypothetical protein
MAVALGVALTACVARPPRIELDEAAWRRSARIELVYVQGAAPTVAYLPAPGPEAKAGEQQALALEDRADDAAGCAPLSMPANAAQAASRHRAAWAWDVRAARAAPQAFAARLAGEGFDTVFLQVDAQLESDEPLLAALTAAGLRVIALDGDPDAAEHPQALERDIERIRRYNATHAARIAGFQVDVEPYLLPGFRLDAEAGFGRYLALLRSLRTQLGPGLEFSAAVPFWYAGERVAGHNLAAEVIAATDSVAVMSYRTTRAQVEEFSRPLLCLAARHGRRAWVGLELAPLRSEVHLVLDAASLGSRVHREGGRLVLVAGEGLPVASSYAVKAADLSFNGNPQGLRELIATPLPYAGFAGWAINGLSWDGDGSLLR